MCRTIFFALEFNNYVVFEDICELNNRTREARPTETEQFSLLWSLIIALLEFSIILSIHSSKVGKHAHENYNAFKSKLLFSFTF